MKKVFLITTLFLVYLLGVVYLILPSPISPDLSMSKRSDEPGDTWQNPTQKAFFTDKDRQTVLSELQNKFALSLFSIKIPSFRLNYRPEEATTIVRDQLFSYYLEEIVHPLRESLFVNGWEPQNSPLNADKPPEERDKVIIEGIVYRAKITSRPYFSTPLPRLFVWTMVFPLSYLVYFSFKRA
jgi:hypothetical protein